MFKSLHSLSLQRLTTTNKVWSYVAGWLRRCSRVQDDVMTFYRVARSSRNALAALLCSRTWRRRFYSAINHDILFVGGGETS